MRPRTIIAVCAGETDKLGYVLFQLAPWRWRVQPSARSAVIRMGMTSTERGATLAAVLGVRDQRARRGSDLSRSTNASRSIGFRK